MNQAKIDRSQDRRNWRGMRDLKSVEQIAKDAGQIADAKAKRERKNAKRASVALAELSS